MVDSLRSDFYTRLAEVVAGPAVTDPEEAGWLVQDGSQWPLFAVLQRLAVRSPAARRAAASLRQVGPETLQQRQERYAALFRSGSVSALRMYESGALTGRLFSSATIEVERWFRAAGLEPAGAELPDHAANELAFLGHLSGLESAEASDIERAFIEQHAGRWLPALGRALANSGDPLYAPLGQLLVDWFGELSPAPQPTRQPQVARNGPRRRLPVITSLKDCSLCGFCVSVCPKRALAIREDEHTTRLVISASLCGGCGRCVQTCPSSTLRVEPVDLPAGQGLSVLRESPRGTCHSCGAPLISQAELDYVAACLDNPSWLQLCQRCREIY